MDYNAYLYSIQPIWLYNTLYYFLMEKEDFNLAYHIIIVIQIKSKKQDQQLRVHEYYKYHMHYRPNQPNPYLCYGRLSKQAIVDARAIEDEDRLMFIAKNQNKLRAECLQGIFDAVQKV